VNSTISGNSACCGGVGGGIYNHNSLLQVTNSTITGNSAGSGGGIYNDQGQFEISNTILNAGASGENISTMTAPSLHLDIILAAMMAAVI
jgi:Chlamydia polymorphic membrane protein (Chlamydia_PMP) repeat